MRNLYYSFKPFVPRALRIALRSSFAEKRRQSVQDVWPIDASTTNPPPGWNGWPDGKKFAVVLTHDVEDAIGLSKCSELQQIETTQGFKSSFNFIPEGTYKVPPALRQSLVDAGFEVGIHDLHHDGKLFQNRKKFEKYAGRINQYLADWNAVGFRAGFMLRNLDWFHDLNILYDASTFDTDPFEPQPEGARTIFPYWIDRPKPTHTGAAHQRHGYVELPYTLPQDSNLFLILKETTPRIWIEKMHWIAQHGGMVLINVHPDYIRHSDSDRGKLLYPASHYVELLKTIREQYAGQYWNPLPKELALWYREQIQPKVEVAPTPTVATVSRGALRTKRAAVVLYSEFPDDPRPRRAAEAMVQEGMDVDFFCIGDKKTPPGGEMLYGVRVFRYPMKRTRDNKYTYLLKYSQFIFAAFRFLARRSLRRRYDVVHIHNMPDVLVFSALIPKLLGAKLMLDLHDPMPELMMTIFGGGKETKLVRTLKWFEKLSIGFVDRAITVNIACKRIFSNRSCRADKVTVIMNAPDETIFAYRDVSTLPVRELGSEKPFVIMYHGSLVDRHGLDIAVDALGLILKDMPNAQLRVYGTQTPYLTKVLDSITDPKLKEAVQFIGPRKLEGIVEAIRECDVGVIPNRRSIFTELNTPTRIFEYLSQGKPVIAPRAHGILDYFGAEDLVYFDLGDRDELAAQMRFVHDNPERVHNIVARGQGILREHTWSNERKLFLNTVIDVLAGRTDPSTTVQATAPATQGAT